MSRDAQPNVRVLFGRKLRLVRQERGYSQEQLADRAGLDRTYVSSCERGKRNISLENIWRLARALGVDPSELISNRPAEFAPGPYDSADEKADG